MISNIFLLFAAMSTILVDFLVTVIAIGIAIDCYRMRRITPRMALYATIVICLTAIAIAILCNINWRRY